MIIETGYWNYYMSFRLSDNKKLFHDIVKKKVYSEGIIGVALDETAMQNANLNEYFSERKMSMLPIIEKRVFEAWDKNVEEQLYVENKLPEYYFDFTNVDGQCADILELEYRKNIAEIHEIHKVFTNMTRGVNKESWCCMALMPLKVELKPLVYEYCPVFLYLFENGYGVIKVSIRISECEADCLSRYPMKTWFHDVKAWEPLMNPGGKKEFKIYANSSGQQNISIITHILGKYIYTLFDGNLLDEKIFSCFETFTIASTKSKQLWKIDTEGSLMEKKELYCFTNPENFMAQMTPDRWREFWQNCHLHFNGFELLKGQNCRLIIFTEPDTLKKQFHRENIKNFASYLNTSIQRSFELLLVISLCQKDDELHLYRASESNIHNIDKQMAKYNQNQNFFEKFMDIVPYNARAFYIIIREINDTSFVNTNVRTERLKQIEAYQKNLFTEKRSLTFEIIAFIASMLFGLPMICETMTILRYVFLPAGNFIQGEFTQKLAIAIWLMIIVLTGTYLRKAYKQYQSRKI